MPPRGNPETAARSPADTGLGKQLAVQDRLALDMSLAVTNRDLLDFRSFTGIVDGVRVDSIPVVIPEMLQLTYDFALTIPHNHLLTLSCLSPIEVHAQSF